jgi:deoxyribonuclease V
LEDLDLHEIAYIIIDGFVYLDDEGKKGLGAYLYETLLVKVPVIGVAKTSFHNNKLNVIEIKRGESNNPLFVSAIGMEVAEAAERIKNMTGAYRMPDLLKEVDTKTKEIPRE